MIKESNSLFFGRFVASNKQLMEDIRNNRKAYLSRRNELVRIMENLEPIREMLRGFGSLYIRDVTADNINFMLDEDQRRRSVAVSVVHNKAGGGGALPNKDSGLGESTGSRLSLCLPVGKGSVSPASSARGASGACASASANNNNSSRTSQGLWSTYRWGHVAIGEEKQQVIGRSYIQPLHEDALIKEIARLR